LPLLVEHIGLIRLYQACKHGDLAAYDVATFGISYPTWLVEPPDVLDLRDNVSPLRQRLEHRLKVGMLGQACAVMREN
jgi:hypothetical protein